MPHPVESQPVLTELTSSAIFMIVTLDAGGEDGVRDLLADISGLTRSVASIRRDHGAGAHGRLDAG